MNLQCYQTSQAPNISQPNSLLHQQMIQQQLQLQQLQLQQQQQQLISMGASPMGGSTVQQDFSHSQTTINPFRVGSSLHNTSDNTASDVTFASPTNTKADQKKQLHLSKDAGIKCSQI